MRDIYISLKKKKKKQSQASKMAQSVKTFAAPGDLKLVPRIHVKMEEENQPPKLSFDRPCATCDLYCATCAYTQIMCLHVYTNNYDSNTLEAKFLCMVLILG